MDRGSIGLHYVSSAKAESHGKAKGRGTAALGNVLSFRRVSGEIFTVVFCKRGCVVRGEHMRGGGGGKPRN